jgi:hypothetical protein
LSRHAKSNGIDADTLTRLPLVDPLGLQPLELPGTEQAALDRRVGARDRLTRAGAQHKVRIKDLVRQLMPATPLTGELGLADLAVLERFADPRALLAVGVDQLTALIVVVSLNHQGRARAEQWLAGRWDGRWQLDVRDGVVAATTPDTQVEAFEVTPGKAYGHAKGDPFSQTNYRF